MYVLCVTMPKEVLLYGYIDSYSSAETVRELIAAGDEDVQLRVNTPGGSPEYTWGVVSKFASLAGAKKISVDGQAHSAGCYACCYADDVEAVDTAEFLIHRASYGEWYEKSDYFDDATKGNLIRVNASLEKALRGKIDVAAFEALKGVKLKDIFSMDTRLDVYLTAKEAKQVGLINRVVTITPKKKAEITAGMEKVASRVTGMRMAASSTEPQAPTTPEIKTTKNMNLAELKAQHAAVYAEAFAEGKEAENDRVGSWLAYSAVDAEAVAAGIKSGKGITETQRSEFAVKQASKTVLGKLEATAPEAVQTEEQKTAASTAAQKTAAAEKDIDAALGLKSKN